MDVKAKIAEFLRELIQYHGTDASRCSGEAGSACAVLRNVLIQLQCRYEEKELDETRLFFYFDYQGGHFRVLVPKEDSFFATIYFHAILSVPEDELPCVRYVCNFFNELPSGIKSYYGYNDVENEYEISLSANIFLSGSLSSPLEYLTSMLNSFFGFRRSLFDKYTELHKQAGNDDGAKDMEMLRDNDRRETRLLLEAEMRHGSGETAYGNDTSPVEPRLVPMLEELLDLHGVSPTLMTVARPKGGIATIEDAGLLAGYNPVRAIIEGEEADAVFCDDTATITLTFTESGMSEPRTAVIHVSSEQCSEFVLYARLSAMLVPLPASRQHAAGTEANTARCKSVIVAYDKKSQHQQRQEFCYMYDDAQDKMAKGDVDELSEEQRLIVDITNQPIGHDLYWGHKYMRQKRYYEATLHLINVYRLLNSRMASVPAPSDKVRDVFYETAFILGFCYCAMRCYQKAYFYLDALFPLNRVNYTMEYVNCLVNSNDFRAGGLVSGLLEKISALEQECIENDEELDEGIKTFRNFLRRRQVYLMVSNGEYEQAKKLLNKMILEPDNTDFALNELAYIQKAEEDESS